MTLITFMDYDEIENLSPPVTKNDILQEKKLLLKWAEEAKENGNRRVAEHFYYWADNVCRWIINDLRL